MWLAFIVATIPSSVSAAIKVPEGFVVENAFPAAEFDKPVQIVFLPDGRKLVVELPGRVWTILPSGMKWPVPFIDLSEEVRNEDDLGMIGCAVDPDFPEESWVYLSYVVEPDDPPVKNDQFSRLARYRFSTVSPHVADLSTRQVLIGQTWKDGIPVLGRSHSIGALRFAADKSLLVSSGDGGHFTHADSGGVDPEAFGPGNTDPSEDIGAFRARSLGSMAGKILRLDKDTGLGLDSNPFWDGDPGSDRSRIWAYGLRNPYRFCIRPGTGSIDPADGDPGVLYVGDVGWLSYEEFLIVPRGGMNFGWPCYEGSRTQLEYDQVRFTSARNDSILCSARENVENPARVTFPTLWWHHGDGHLSFPIGWTGSTVVGGVFYTGADYPDSYHGRYFVGDYVQGWIRTIEVDDEDGLTGWGDFATDAEGPVAIETDPATGDLYYISIFRNEVRRIRYERPPDPEVPITGIVTTSHPNPFQRSVTIEFEISDPSDTSIEVFSAHGRMVRGLAATHHDAGPHSLVWDGNDDAGNRVSRGIYFYRIRAGGWEQCRKITLR